MIPAPYSSGSSLCVAVLGGPITLSRDGRCGSSSWAGDSPLADAGNTTECRARSLDVVLGALVLWRVLCDVLGGSALGCGGEATTGRAVGAAGRADAGPVSTRAAACVEDDDEQVINANSFRRPLGRGGSCGSGRRGPAAERACSMRAGVPTAVSVSGLTEGCEPSTLGRASDCGGAPSAAGCFALSALGDCDDECAMTGDEGARERLDSGSGTSTGECGAMAVVVVGENPAACTGFPSAIDDCAAPWTGRAARWLEVDVGCWMSAEEESAGALFRPTYGAWADGGAMMMLTLGRSPAQESGGESRSVYRRCGAPGQTRTMCAKCNVRRRAELT